VISAAAGKQVTYTDLPAQELAGVLAGAGLPAEVADSVADADLGLSRGELFTGSGDLRRLTGRPTTLLADAIAAALR
jgi:NAD(P)H dehydrogenase (quinone)